MKIKNIPVTDIAANPVNTGEAVYHKTGKRLGIGEINAEQAAEGLITGDIERLKIIFNAMPMGIALINSKTAQIIEANPAYASIAGRTIEELSKLDWISITHPQDVQADLDNMEQLISGKITGFQMDKRYVHPDGKIVWIKLTATALKKEANGEAHHIAMIEDITESKREQQELSISELNLKRGERAAKIGYWEFNLSDKTVFVSKGAMEIYGTDKQCLTLDELKNFRLPGYEAYLDEALRQLLEANTNYDVVFKIKRGNDGAIRDVRLTAENFLEKNVIFGTIQDITENEHTLMALGISKNRYKTLFEKASDGILILDAGGKMISINESFAHMHGYAVEELLELNLRNLDTPEMAKQLPQMIARVLAGETIHIEVAHYHKQGHIIWLSVSSSLIHIGDESFIQAFHNDITDRKKNEQQIKHLSQAVEQSPVSIVITDTKGNIEYVNPKFEESTGYSFAEVKGENPRILKSGHITPGEYKQLWETIVQGKTWIGELQNRKKNGELFWEMASISSMYDDQGEITHYLAIKEDITLRKQSELRLLRSEAELKSSNTELENFAYIASHDLQEPLRMISSFLSLLERRTITKLDEASKEFMHFAVDGALRMKMLIKDLLEYSKIGTNKESFCITDLNVLLQFCTQVLQEKIKAKKALITIHDLPLVKVNEGLITQLFINLLSNALKYQTDRVSEIEIGWTEKPGEYIFYVKDNGIGMDPKFYDQIFIIFKRLHSVNEYSGSGIGLALCKKIVEIHEGSIWVESELGKGSIFYFSLPHKGDA